MQDGAGPEGRSQPLWCLPLDRAADAEAPRPSAKHSLSPAAYRAMEEVIALARPSVAAAQQGRCRPLLAPPQCRRSARPSTTAASRRSPVDLGLEDWGTGGWGGINRPLCTMWHGRQGSREWPLLSLVATGPTSGRDR